MRKRNIKTIILIIFLVFVCPQHDINAESQDLATQFITAAKQGDSKAQLIVGVMYKEGFGVRQDSETAFEWIPTGSIPWQY